MIQYRMFKDNSFATQYFQIISDAKTRGDQYKSRYLARKHLGYVEGHHIQPSSLDGPDTRENIVWLTAYEHLKCHLLLTEMCADEGSRHKMLLAVTRMVNKQDSRRDREKLLLQQITDEEIMWLAKIREDAAEAHSAHMKVKHAGEGNPFYGRKHTAEKCANTSLQFTENNPMHHPESVSKMLGHSSLKRTQIYSMIVAAKLKQEMKGLRDLF